jgi:hypothetical protein
VAAKAVVSDPAVAKRRRRPTRRLVAILTDIVCCNVVCRFARRLCAIVAAEAVVGDPAVTKRRRRPTRRFMTILADITGR